MAEKRDLYEVLGVERTATRDEIRKVYKKLARQFHPDLNPGDEKAEARFKEIASAWAVLSDDEKRSDYDEFGEISLDAGFDAEEARKIREQFGARFGSRDPRSHGVPRDDFHFGGIDDLLGRMFSQESGSGQNVQFRGPDLEASLDLSFLEAVTGGEKQLTLGRPDAAGGVVGETVTVRIPPGVSSKGRLRIPGKGGPGVGGGPPGDLWVTLKIGSHPVFDRDGKNLTLDLPISVSEAILGASVEVPTLDGRVKLTIPPGTDSGTRLRLKGRGVPAARGGVAGDLLVRVQISVPKDLDDAGREAVAALSPLENQDIRKELFE